MSYTYANNVNDWSTKKSISNLWSPNIYYFTVTVD